MIYYDNTILCIYLSRIVIIDINKITHQICLEAPDQIFLQKITFPNSPVEAKPLPESPLFIRVAKNQKRG